MHTTHMLATPNNTKTPTLACMVLSGSVAPNVVRPSTVPSDMHHSVAFSMPPSSSISV